MSHGAARLGGKMAVRFDSEMNNEINKVFQNYNAKIRYYKTRTKGKGMLPQKISIREFKKKYSDKTRKEVLRQLDIYRTLSIKSLKKHGEESRLSQWEYNYFVRNRAKTLSFYDKEIADFKRIIGNKPEYHLRLIARYANLMSKREFLSKDLSSLSEQEIKSMRRIYSYAERSELVKQQGFRLYLRQITRTMELLGYTKKDIDSLLNTFNQLSENEFTEMVRNEDIIDVIYDIVDSPKGRGQYQLMAEENRTREVIETIRKQAATLVAKYKVTD